MYSEESNCCYEKRISFYKFFESFINPCSESLIKRTVRKVIGCIRRFFLLQENSSQKGILKEFFEIRNQFLWFGESHWNKFFEVYKPEHQISVKGREGEELTQSSNSSFTLCKMKYTDFEEFLERTNPKSQ